MNPKLAHLRPFIVMEVLEKAQAMEKQGHSIIHLEVGEPDFTIPERVQSAHQQAMIEGHTHYTHSLGNMDLRKAISQDYQKKYGVNIEAERIIITSGTSPALLLAFSALLEKGDEVILSNPHYACYPNFLYYSEAVPVMLPVYEENGFQYDIEVVKQHITQKTKAIIINSPANPTGQIIDKTLMQAIASLEPYIISDEIYHGLVYAEKAHSILEFTEHAFVLNGFSKLYAMTGLRLGYIIVPEVFIRPIQIMQQNFFICPSSIAQIAAIAALQETPDELKAKQAIYNERRQYMIQRLRNLGFHIPIEPKGAFYIFVNAKHLSQNSYQLAFDILEKAKVGVTPGIDFGSHGEGYLRFSYANSLENIKAGLDRLEIYLQQYHKG